MPQIGIFLLVNVFTALLPPHDPDEKSYYDALGVDAKTSTNEDIRRAYKKLSLQLHPDKVAQRGANDTEKERAAAEYERIQEAYSVLVNEEKRQKYDILKTPTRYRFVVEKGALAAPGALYENLTGASFVDKTKLVGFATVCILLILLQPILIASKVNQSLDQSGDLEDAKWTAIFVPTWIIGAILIIFTIVLIPMVPPAQRLPISLWALELVLWYMALIFLCLRWDGTWTSLYRRVLTPVYLAMLLRWMQSVLVLRKVRMDVQRMVTAEFLESQVLKGKSLEDLTESEQEDLKRNFLVVSVPMDFEPMPTEEGVELDEAKIEEQKVEASAEFEAATEIYNQTFLALICSIVFGGIYMILLTQKLDGKLNGSWWAVFTPIWLWLGSRWLLNFYRCICGTAASDEILLHMKEMNEVEEDEKQQDDDNDDPKAKTNGDEMQKDVVESEEEVETTTKVGVSTDTETDVEKEGAPFDENKTTVSPEVKDDTEGTPDALATKDDDAKGSATGTGDKKETSGVSEDDDAEYIHVDEETFKAWQSAYEQAEETAMQEQAKACTECCNLTFQLTLLCLIVAKIEKNWQNDDPNDTGFNVFWILFPFFVFFGLFCCCCALLIYGAAPGSASDLYDTPEGGKAEEDPENPPTSDLDEPVIPQPPHPKESVLAPDAAPTNGEMANEDVDEEAPPHKESPEATNMDDLD